MRSWGACSLGLVSLLLAGVNCLDVRLLKGDWLTATDYSVSKKMNDAFLLTARFEDCARRCAMMESLGGLEEHLGLVSDLIRGNWLDGCLCGKLFYGV